MNWIWLNWIWIDLYIWNQSKSEMIVLGRYRDSKSMDWIDCKDWKSARIHSLKLKWLILIMIGMVQHQNVEMNQNHFTYWIVNHWKWLKLLDVVFVISEVNLNCEIWIIWNQSKSEELEGDRRISYGVRS